MIIKFYAVNQTNDGKSVNHKPFCKDLLDIVDGFTTYQAQGNWKDSEGKLYSEPVTVYEIVIAECVNCWKQKPESNERLTNLIILFRVFGKMAEQKAILWIVDNEGHTLTL